MASGRYWHWRCRYRCHRRRRCRRRRRHPMLLPFRFAIQTHAVTFTYGFPHEMCARGKLFCAFFFSLSCHLVFIYIYFIRHTKGLLFSYLLKEFCSLNSVKEISKPKTFIWGELIISPFSALLFAFVVDYLDWNTAPTETIREIGFFVSFLPLII